MCSARDRVFSGLRTRARETMATFVNIGPLVTTPMTRLHPHCDGVL